MRILTFIIVLLISIVPCFASEQDITATERNEIIDEVIDNLANKYVDPNLGKKTAEIIKQKRKQNAYDSLNQKSKLIESLIADMHKATNDKHLQLVDPKGFDQAPPDGSPQTRPKIQVFNPNATSQNDIQQNKLIEEMFKKTNYGLRNAEVIEGNIGYLDIRQFLSPRMAPDVYKAIDNIMKTFQDCSAVILDLRRCSAGGDPETTMYIASYFLDPKQSVSFYESYNREKQKIAEFRTRTDIAGKCLPDVPLYILVGSKTFSAGEMFAYGLQNIGRAKIVGETSAGAAHETNTIGIGHGIMMVLPVNRLVHAKTKTNWQGTGVVPDISVKADDALTAAKEIIQEAKSSKK